MEPFGHKLLQSTFLLQPEIININHGSFGTVPKPVMDAHFRLLMEQESCPEVWFRKTYFEYIDKSRKCIADLIHSDVEDVVVLENASSAVNSILRSYPFKEGDKVLLLSSAYKMVIDTLKFLETTHKIEIVTVDIPYPLRDEGELVNAVKHTFATVPGIKMCVFSHISSMPTIVEPVKELTRISKEHGAVVIIDGAHAPGVIDIDVNDIGADYYLGNCHKWLFCPKGSAFLWASHDNHPRQYPQPAVISSSGKYDYVDRFAYTGTRDYIALCAIPDGIQFVKDTFGGLTKMRSYCRTLLQQACELLIAKWNTSYLTPISSDAFMANVLLPLTTEEEAKHVQTVLFETYKVTMVYGYVPRRTDDDQTQSTEPAKLIYFIRLSSQVYLELSDFELLAEKVLSILQDFSTKQ